MGSLLRLEERIESLLRSDGAKGFISASMLFTVGPMTLVGCILEGAKKDSTLILSKAFMDGISSVVLASSLGKGVVFSAIYVLLFQGTITFLAYFYGEYIREQSMANSLFIGGGLMVANALKMLQLNVGLRVFNLLPALLLALFL